MIFKLLTKITLVFKGYLPVLIISLCILSGTGCGQLSTRNKVKSQEDKKAIARVGSNYLYQSDLKGMVPKNASKQDSFSIVKRYVNNWIRKQLMIEEASSQINFDKADLERKILNYRYALMVYEFEKHYVKERLNENVSSEEIKDYFDKNKDNFNLKQNIIRGYFAKIPKKAPRTNQFRDLMKGRLNKESLEKIKSFCFRFAESYSIEDSVWLKFDELAGNSPLMDWSDRSEALKNRRYLETEDQNYMYFLRIKNFREAGKPSPLGFVYDEIEDIIINKRKKKITEELQDKVYRNAKNNDGFEILSDSLKTYSLN